MKNNKLQLDTSLKSFSVLISVLAFDCYIQYLYYLSANMKHYINIDLYYEKIQPS